MSVQPKRNVSYYSKGNACIPDFSLKARSPERKKLDSQISKQFNSLTSTIDDAYKKLANRSYNVRQALKAVVDSIRAQARTAASINGSAGPLTPSQQEALSYAEKALVRRAKEHLEFAAGRGLSSFILDIPRILDNQDRKKELEASNTLLDLLNLKFQP